MGKVGQGRRPHRMPLTASSCKDYSPLCVLSKCAHSKCFCTTTILSVLYQVVLQRTLVQLFSSLFYIMRLFKVLGTGHGWPHTECNSMTSPHFLQNLCCFDTHQTNVTHWWEKYRELYCTLLCWLSQSSLLSCTLGACRILSNWERVKCSGMQRRVRPRSIRGWMAAWVGQTLPVGTKCHHAPSNLKYPTIPDHQVAPYPVKPKIPHTIPDHQTPLQTVPLLVRIMAQRSLLGAKCHHAPSKTFAPL